MKTLLNKFLHNSFFTYIKALQISPVANKRDTGYTVEYLVSIFSALTIFWIVSGFENLAGTQLYFTAVVGVFLYAMWLVLGMFRRSKPSPLTLAPIGWKKRVVYSYLSNLVYSIIAALIIALFALIIFLFVAFIVFISSGESVFSIEDDVEPIRYAVAAKGQLFTAFAGLLIYGMGALITHIDNKKWRLSLTVSFPVALELIGLLVLNCAHSGGFVLTGSIAAEFENLPVSWLWLTFTAIAAVAVTVLSVLFAINYERPSKI